MGDGGEARVDVECADNVPARKIFFESLELSGIKSGPANVDAAQRFGSSKADAEVESRYFLMRRHAEQQLFGGAFCTHAAAEIRLHRQSVLKATARCEG